MPSDQHRSIARILDLSDDVFRFVLFIAAASASEFRLHARRDRHNGTKKRKLEIWKLKEFKIDQVAGGVEFFGGFEHCLRQSTSAGMKSVNTGTIQLFIL